ncbi:MAG: hypothetical protein CMH53_04165 [Myxococcales bacterium]|nr:hypothetical protein [Myxococcales bacterium]
MSNGLLKGIGVGATLAVALLIPFPILLLGGVLYLSSKAKPEPPPEPESCPLTAEEMADLVQFAELIDRAPNPQAAEALIEEFYV